MSKYYVISISNISSMFISSIERGDVLA
jgi:hypothetical protein